MRFVLEGLTDRVLERVTVGDRERLTEVVGDRVKGRVVGMAERERVTDGDRERLTEVVRERITDGERVKGLVVAIAVLERVKGLVVAIAVLERVKGLVVAIAVLERVKGRVVGMAERVTDGDRERLTEVVCDRVFGRVVANAVLERVTDGDRERLTEVVRVRVTCAVVGFTLRLTVRVGVIVVLVDRVNWAVVGTPVRDRVLGKEVGATVPDIVDDRVLGKAVSVWIGERDMLVMGDGVCNDDTLALVDCDKNGNTIVVVLGLRVKTDDRVTPDTV